MPVRYNLPSVWVRLSIFSQLSIYTICGAVCFQFTHFLRDDWENIHTLSYYHHQIGSMNYYPLFRVRSWNNGMRCMSFYILKIQCLLLTMSSQFLTIQQKFMNNSQVIMPVVMNNSHIIMLGTLCWTENCDWIHSLRLDDAYIFQ